MAALGLSSVAGATSPDDWIPRTLRDLQSQITQLASARPASAPVFYQDHSNTATVTLDTDSTDPKLTITRTAPAGYTNLSLFAVAIANVIVPTGTPLKSTSVVTLDVLQAGAQVGIGFTSEVTTDPGYDAAVPAACGGPMSSIVPSSVLTVNLMMSTLLAQTPPPTVQGFMWVQWVFTP